MMRPGEMVKMRFAGEAATYDFIDPTLRHPGKGCILWAGPRTIATVLYIDVPHPNRWVLLLIPGDGVRWSHVHNWSVL